MSADSRLRAVAPPALSDVAGGGPRPLQELARSLHEIFLRLQPAAPGTERSPGDRLAELAFDRGAIADTARDGLGRFEEVLRWLDKALTDMDPWLIQVDVVLAYGTLVAGALDGAVGAGQGLASLGKALVKPNETPAQVYAQLGGSPEILESYRRLQSDLAILPPPEDLAECQAALLPLLTQTPDPGVRSIPSLRRTMAGLGVP